MAPDDIVGTDTWTEQILDAIHTSRAMIVLVSSAANASPHVSREVNLALGRKRAVLPIRIEAVAPGGSLEYLLSLVQRVDAFPPPISNHSARVLRRLEALLQSTAPDATAVAATTVAASAATAAAAQTTPQPAAPQPPPVQPAPPPPITSPTSGPAGANRTPIVIGAAVVAVAAVALVGSGLLGKPGPSPATTQGAVATSAATANSTEQPPASEVPSSIDTGGALNDAQRQLRDRLPAIAGVDACVAWPTPPGGEDVLSPSGYAGSIARISCPVSGSSSLVRYALYSSTQALDADFATVMSNAGVASGGACVTAIPANSPWSFPNSPNSGDLACFERAGQVQYVWTQRDLGVLAQWLAPDNAEGYAFWRTWTTTLNAAETALLGRLPATVDDLGTCVRAADHYYASALALITCPVSGNGIVYYAAFPSADAFPNDPMTQQFGLIMQNGGFTEDTATGCYDETPAYGRYTWAFKDASGNLGPTEGYLGCYIRTDTTPQSVQYVWTYNASATMGLWAAPDLQSGIDFFDSWIRNLPR